MRKNLLLPFMHYCYQKKSKTTNKELSEMLSTMSWSEIGRKYNVSNNAVRKWVKSYGIQQVTGSSPVEDVLKKLINKSSKKQLKFWLKMFQAEVSSMEKRLVEHKRLIQELKAGIKRKKK